MLPGLLGSRNQVDEALEGILHQDLGAGWVFRMV